jgi:phosphoglycolate phosphatase-like HAD superfamily hydrolase
MKAIYLDMDGTIVDFYRVPNWLEYLERGDVYPYKAAKPLVNLSLLARRLNFLRARGYHLGIISWSSKGSTPEYDNKVAIAKRQWLAKHLHSVTWDEIEIVPYGFPKQKAVLFANDGILFDDEERNRTDWTGTAYDVDNILEILKGLL